VTSSKASLQAKAKGEVQKMEVDPEKTTVQDIIQIGSMDAPIGQDGKRPIIPTMRPLEVVPTLSTSCQGGVLPD
jgi:hypothetical protein